jgi:hypothetical protein
MFRGFQFRRQMASLYPGFLITLRFKPHDPFLLLLVMPLPVSFLGYLGSCKQCMRVVYFGLCLVVFNPEFGVHLRFINWGGCKNGESKINLRGPRSHRSISSKPESDGIIGVSDGVRTDLTNTFDHFAFPIHGCPNDSGQECSRTTAEHAQKCSGCSLSFGRRASR